MTIHDESLGVAAGRGETAAQRAAELHEVNARLARGDTLTALDVRAAGRHAREAHERARRAHLAAAESHRRAGEAHDRAAQAHRRAAAEGIGDVATHLRAAALHESARDRDYRAAELDTERAAAE